MHPVSYGVELTAEQRLAVAEVSEVGQRWTFGDLKHQPKTEAVAALHEITRDPAVLGIALGGALATVELDGYALYYRLAELYRAAGADEQIAAVNLEWRRAQRAWRTTRR